MKGGEVIREARLRAGLTQQELAERLATTQSVITRWETGQRSPTFETVVRAVRACGLDLGIRVVARDDDHERLIDDNLRLTPTERLERLRQSRQAMDELVSKAKRGQRAVRS